MYDVTPKILLVDDIQLNLDLLEEMLEEVNASYDRAYSGEEALKKIEEEEYALVLLDVQMPGLNGFETAEKIWKLKHGKDLPIIFITAISIEEKFVIKGYESGAVDYLVKPFDPILLISKVDVFCRLHIQKKELELKNN